NRRESPDVLAITCFVEGNLAGNCEIMFHTGMKTSHRATIAIAILREYWGLGIGSCMFEQMIAAARERGTKVMELDFIKGNDRAQRLYQKYGFEIIAEKPMAIRQRDGRLDSLVLMQKYL
ncbi:MAG: GNAT family N-acetyltransferase, partial [Clostridia bacterium]|nr:GNAT family N-acetyltransferase [Clostridia bacterium]